MRVVLYISLTVIFLAALVLYKTVHSLPAKELKRRSRIHDKNARGIYKVAAYGQSLNILLIIIGFAGAAATIGMVGYVNGWAAIGLLAVFSYLTIGWKASSNTRRWNWTISRLISPVVAFILNITQPILSKLVRSGSATALAPSQVYEKEDLLEFLKAQSVKTDNRISEDELKMAFNALTFGDKKVTDIITPLRQVKLVADTEMAGPMLTDELYKTGFSRFPVVREGTTRTANPTVIGTLYLRDLIGYEGSDRVRDLMDRKVFYINETQSLRDALAAFLKTHHHLFIVVNNFEEVVGVLSIEDVIEQILGENIVDEFDQYDDLRAVAGLEAKKEAAVHQKIKQPKPEE